MNSATVEDYLKTVYLLSHADGGEVPVTTCALATRLGVAPATATSMMQRLAQPTVDLLRYVPYQGVRLTAEGERLALRVIRRHRLLELYLAERLGLRWDEVHAEAERLEHHISPMVEERIAAALGDPQVDCHGHPIPTATGEIPAAAGAALARLAPGQAGVILSVQDEDSAFLRYLADRGLYPGVPLLVTEREPFGGAIHVCIGAGPERHECAVGTLAAERIKVTLNAGAPVPA